MTVIALVFNYVTNTIQAEPVLKKGGRLAIAGDSITQQKLYSNYLETYFLVCAPELDIKVIQLGWSGETAPAFAARMENDLISWKPTVVTTCYGMNDGQYKKYDESIGRTYESNMCRIVSFLKEKGIAVVVGGPGVVDSYTFTRADGYNQTLARLSDIAGNVATRYDCPFADVHHAMLSAMEKAKAAYGMEYHVGGAPRDGVHPYPNGQLVMAYAFLKAMQMNGSIGVITIDWNKQASATEGHKVLSFTNGTVEIESVRYPFCFSGDGKTPENASSILPFVPFQQDLNRLMLVVRSLPAGEYDVKWGQKQQSFSSEQLTSGINLAAEFIENPFQSTFHKVMEQVAVKQAFETKMIKGIVANTRLLKQEFKGDDDFSRLMEALINKMMIRQKEYNDKVSTAVVPLRHTVSIIPK